MGSNAACPVGIGEIDLGCDYNVIRDNELRQLPIEDGYGGGSRSSDYAPTIRTLGAHSTHYNNCRNGLVDDAPDIWTIDRLRQSPPPCTLLGDSHNECIVPVAGVLWRWNNSDTRLDDGVSVIMSGPMITPNQAALTPSPGRWNKLQ
jgi:hypothetical protein